MKRFHGLLITLAVLLMVSGIGGFFFAYTHLPMQTVYVPGSCGTGYPNPPCEVAHKDPQTKQVRVWNGTVAVPIVIGALGLFMLYILSDKTSDTDR